MAYLLGLDGGGTGTIGVLADPDGTIRAIARGSASNYLVAGEQGTLAALSHVIQQLLAQTDTDLSACQHATIGLAGLNHPSDLTVYERLIGQIGLGGSLMIENDAQVLWAGATLCQPGIVVIAGTGSSCYGVNAAGKTYKSLGWDYKLADQGSGYWIGSQGLMAAMKAYDGRIAETCLLDAMVQHYHLAEAGEMRQLAYQKDFEKNRVASFAREVSRCAYAGDPHARAILHQAGLELAEAVIATARALDMVKAQFTLGLIGGVLQAGEFVWQPFREKVLATIPGAQIEEARYVPAVGALLLGAYQQSRLTDSFLQNIQASNHVVAEARFKTG